MYSDYISRYRVYTTDGYLHQSNSAAGFIHRSNLNNTVRSTLYEVPNATRPAPNTPSASVTGEIEKPAPPFARYSDRSSQNGPHWVVQIAANSPRGVGRPKTSVKPTHSSHDTKVSRSRWDRRRAKIAKNNIVPMGDCNGEILQFRVCVYEPRNDGVPQMNRECECPTRTRSITISAPNVVLLGMAGLRQYPLKGCAPQRSALTRETRLVDAHASDL